MLEQLRQIDSTLTDDFKKEFPIVFFDAFISGYGIGVVVAKKEYTTSYPYKYEDIPDHGFTIEQLSLFVRLYTAIWKIVFDKLDLPSPPQIKFYPFADIDCY